MDLDALLAVFDRATANLAKLEAVWERAEPFLPSGPAAGSDPEFEDLERSWADLIAGLPKINGWTITEPLPNMDELGRSFIDWADIGELPLPAWNAREQPARDLAEYRYRLRKARRRAVRGRLDELLALVDTQLRIVVADVARDSQDPLETEGSSAVVDAIREIERLLGDALERRGRWGDLRRHISFSEGHDWHDIVEMDWPSVRPDIEAAAYDDSDPLPIPPDLDLGVASGGDVTGSATTALRWEVLDDDRFERLLFDLLRALPDYENVQWLMRTRAPDRGRDLSLDRVLRDSAGSSRRERVIVQAKHWLSRSVALPDVAATVAGVATWQPPLVRGVIVATTGRFSADAVNWVEQHNERGIAPLVELWPDSQLEALLTRFPQLAVEHGLR